MKISVKRQNYTCRVMLLITENYGDISLGKLYYYIMSIAKVVCVKYHRLNIIKSHRADFFLFFINTERTPFFFKKTAMARNLDNPAAMIFIHLTGFLAEIAEKTSSTAETVLFFRQKYA